MIDPFRENAAPPKPPPDTGPSLKEYEEKLRKGAARREWAANVASNISNLAPIIVCVLVILACIAFGLSARSDYEDRQAACIRKGGTLVLIHEYEYRCIEAKELK
jgi:hypothetical protein